MVRRLRRLDSHRNWRTCFEEAYVCSAIVRWRAGIEPKIVQCAPADRVGVWVLHKGLGVPADGKAKLSDGPWIAAIALAACPVVCPARFLRRRVKSDVVPYRWGKLRNNFEGLNSAIKVLIIDGVLIVPHAVGRACHFITDEENAIVTRIRLDLVHCCAWPSHDGRLRPHRGADSRKRKIGRAAANSKLTVRGVVEHIALARVRLTPRVLVRSDILRFGEKGRTGILRWIQVARRHRDPVRCASMHVTGVIP